VGWLDVAVTAAFVGFGIALAALLLVEGASVIEAALAFLLFGAVGCVWAWQSFTFETLADWRRRRHSRRR
jgi:hypothetical protein